MSCLTRQVIERSGCEKYRCPIEATGLAARRNRIVAGAPTEMRGHARTRAGLGANQSWLRDRNGSAKTEQVRPVEAGEPSHLRAQRQQPLRDGFARGEAGVIEVVIPTVGGSKPLPEPAMKAERRELHCDAISICSSPGVTNAPAWDSPSRRGSSSRSGWPGIRFIQLGSVLPLCGRRAPAKKP